MTFNSAAYAEIKGKGGTPHPEIKGVAALKSSPMQFVLAKDKGAVTFDDIIKKKIKIKINIDEPNSPCHKLFNQMLKEYGLTQSDMEAWGCVFLEKYEQNEIQELCSSGIIDGYFCTVAAPHTMIMQNGQDRELVLITIDPKVINALCKSSGYDQATISAGTYPFLKQDYYTLTDYTILATTNKVSDETVYKMARSIHQNLEYLRLVHASMKNLDEKRMIRKTRNTDS
jgi:TRAP transporter TAXI family solute receptor